MRSGTLALILLSVTLSACAQVLFKLGVSGVMARGAEASASMLALMLAFLLSPGVIGGLTLYGIGTLLWLGVLSRTELSQAYPFVGLGFILTALFGYLFFQDTLNGTRIIGTLLVTAGIVLVARS
jgi:multidrug transporter EmrE-like cation transporter